VLKPLHLYEEVLLLALRNLEGTIVDGSTSHFAIGGALMAELIQCDRVRVDRSNKKKLVEVASSKPVGDDLLDECLAKVAAARRRASLQTWVQRFAWIRQLRHRAAERLCRSGILRMDEDRVLWIFPRTIYPEVDPRPERELIERLTRAIACDKSADSATAALVAIAYHSGLLKRNLDTRLLKARKSQLQRLTEGDLVGDAVKDVIQAMRAAACRAAIVVSRPAEQRWANLF
jgi:golgi phosphoprotein 3